MAKPAKKQHVAKAAARRPKRSTSKPAARSKAAATKSPAARKTSATKKVALKAIPKTSLPASADAGIIKLGYLSNHIGFHLRLAQDASYRVFSRHRDKDLVKPGRFTALAIIHLNPGISQSSLGRAIARDKSTVSPLIKDLQKNGFISRKPSVHDRRSVTLVLTKKGEKTLSRLHARATEHERELDRLIGTSKSRFVATLDKIVTGMAAGAPA